MSKRKHDCDALSWLTLPGEEDDDPTCANSAHVGDLAAPEPRSIDLEVEIVIADTSSHRGIAEPGEAGLVVTEPRQRPVVIVATCRGEWWGDDYDLKGEPVMLPVAKYTADHEFRQYCRRRYDFPSDSELESLLGIKLGCNAEPEFDCEGFLAEGLK